MKYLTPKEKIRLDQYNMLRRRKFLARKKSGKLQHSRMFGNSVYEIIRLPVGLDFSTNKIATLEFFKSFREKFLIEDKDAYLDFSKLLGISPAASIVLLAEIYRCWKLKGKKIVARSISNKLRHVFKATGFVALLEADLHIPENSRKSSSKKYIKFVSGLEDDGELADKIRNAVGNHNISISEEIRHKIYSGLLGSVEKFI
ncbi:MAG: hypothetical protein WCL30_01695 [Pseudomonadota bacterium]